MFERILVPLDGSPRAELILSQIARILRRDDAEVRLLRVVDIPEAVGRISLAILRQKEREEAQQYLHDIILRFGDKAEKIHARVAEGWTAEVILETARTEGATMIAMTTHGRTGILRWLMGSVADKVLRASEVPVLLLRAVHPPNTPALASGTSGALPFRRILIATDDSPSSMAIVDPAMQLAVKCGSEIVALHVWDSYVLDGSPLLGMEAGMTPPPDAPLSSEDEVTARVARQLAPSGIKVTRVTRYGEPATEILDHSFKHNVDLIAIATHDRWELSRWMTGSVPERVLRSAGVPLLIVRAAEKPALVTRGQ